MIIMQDEHACSKCCHLEKYVAISMATAVCPNLAHAWVKRFVNEQSLYSMLLYSDMVVIVVD